MLIDRRRLLGAGAVSVVGSMFPAEIVQALDGPAFFAKDSLLPDWLNLSGNPVWFGVDVMVSSRGADELATVLVTRMYGHLRGSGIEMLMTLTTREIAAEQGGQMPIYTVSPVRPLQVGECLAYVKKYFPLNMVTANAVWTGSPCSYWSGFHDARYQPYEHDKHEGVREFRWMT